MDDEAMRWVGVVVCFLGGLLRIIPVYVLRNRFSGLVAIQPGHRLETRGIYGVIRNPSYLGLLVSSPGWVLTFRSGIGVLLVVCAAGAAGGADPRRGAAAARALRCRLRCLLQAHVAAVAGDLLKQDRERGNQGGLIVSDLPSGTDIHR